MKVFLDTNVVLEYLIQREQYETVGAMFMRKVAIIHKTKE